MMRDRIMRLIDHLTPDHRKKWAQAMRAEISCFDKDREAAIFALGCLIACCRFHLELKISPEKTWSDIMKDRFTFSTFFAGSIACLIGLTYLFVSGAPLTMIIVNGAAMFIGILLTIAVKLSVRMTSNFVTVIAVMGSLGLFGTAMFGTAIADARRWLLVGPFFVQTSLILLPLIALSFARIQNFWTTLAVLLAGSAMALQPDRAMAAMLFVAVAIVCWMRPGKWTFSAVLFCAIAFAATLFLPDRLPAVPFVDHILWTAFDINIMIGLLLWIGCIALVCPVLFVPKNERTVVHYTFAVCWFVLIAAAAMGAYPTPIVGYGASAIIGYFLSLILVQPIKQARLVDDSDCNNISETQENASLLRTQTPSFAI
ncbi:hypothetical protein [Parasphingorhabdus cellanae]|uniref:DUF2157 domain-containing protein n=1 Tax=Parasphingorhabdus cellanae TaxID=2806553 RepID=A0ABX7T0W3_9SPHN|nr:hypothetical protein [Parasphingorhabdus cellanae]QTD54603.1 hypothetical protein J4G78_09920 [Parasphingorhabdus cellanae]